MKVSEGLLLPEGILPLTLATYAFSGLEKYCCINKNKWKSGFTRQSLSNVQISFVLPSPIYHTAMCKYCYKIRSLLLQSQDIAAVIKWRRIARGNYQISYYQKLKHKFKKQNKTKQSKLVLEAKTRRNGKLDLIPPLQASARVVLYSIYIEQHSSVTKDTTCTTKKKKQWEEEQDDCLAYTLPTNNVSRIQRSFDYKDVQHCSRTEKMAHTASRATWKTQLGMGKPTLHATKCLTKLKLLYIPSDCIHRNLNKAELRYLTYSFAKVVLSKV